MDEPRDDLHQRYQNDHKHPWNQALHMVGVPIIAAGVVMLFVRPALGLAGIGLGYGVNFVGHAIEGTMPSLFRDPRHVLMGAYHFGGRYAQKLRGNGRGRQGSR